MRSSFATTTYALFTTDRLTPATSYSSAAVRLLT